MKRIKYIFGIMFALSFCGCDLLDTSPVNSMVPKTVEHFESLMAGGYPPSCDIFTGLAFLSDDVYINGATSYTLTATYEPFFVWAETHQVDDGTTDYLWQSLYKSIYYANTVIDKFKAMAPSTEEKDRYETVFGEAYALRAYSYFYLINTYADTYEEANLDKPGVPMPLTAEDVNTNIGNNVREPIGHVWAQIVEDIEAATTYLHGKKPKNDYRFSYSALEALKARVYLFTGDWEKSIKAATNVISTKTLFDMNLVQSKITANKSNLNAFGGDHNGFLETDYSKEVLLYMGARANHNPFNFWTGASKPEFTLYDLCMRYQGDFDKDEDVQSMDVADYRAFIYCHFIPTSDINYDATGNTVYNMYSSAEPTYALALRLGEVYVTRAEAYMRKESPEKDKAISDLNTLLQNRIRASVFTDLGNDDFPDNEALLTRILEERRLETALEGGLRWFDLRRLGKPELKHYYKNIEYTLPQGGPRYIMQIPMSEQIASPNMPLNPR